MNKWFGIAEHIHVTHCRDINDVLRRIDILYIEVVAVGWHTSFSICCHFMALTAYMYDEGKRWVIYAYLRNVMFYK